MTDVADALLYAMSPTSGGDLLEILAAHHDACVRAAVASNDMCPGTLLEALSGDPDARVRAAVASRLTGAMLDSMAGDPDATVRVAVASQSTNQTVLRQLTADGNPLVRAAVAANPHAEIEVLHGLRDDAEALVCQAADAQASERTVKVLVAETELGYVPPSLHDDVIDVAAAMVAQDPMERVKLAAWRACPPEVIEMLTNDGESFVRATAASRETCSDAALDGLSGDADELVRAAVCHQRPERAAKALGDSSALVARTVTGTLQDPGLLDALGGSDDPSVRAMVAANAHSAPQTVLRLLADPDPMVSLTAASHRALGPQLAQVVDDAVAHDNAPVGLALASRDDLTAAMVVSLAKHRSDAVRRQIAIAHPDVPARLDSLTVNELCSWQVGAWRDRVVDLAGAADENRDDATQVVLTLAESFHGTVAELAVVAAACIGSGR